ncbi:MAG: hypothetical protein JOZ65_15715 [Chloroflexi bacterium]|nr:hypothetical protein [Chloroflexota bacterium]
MRPALAAEVPLQLAVNARLRRALVSVSESTKMRTVAITLLVCAVFVIARSGSDLIWDDTSDFQFPHTAPAMFELSGLTYVAASAQQAVATPSLSGYRPISQFITLLGVRVQQEVGCCRPAVVWLIPIGLIIGLVAALYYAVAKSMLRSQQYAAVATVFTLSSIPFVASSFVVFAGVQALVPLFILLGLMSYEQVRKKGITSRWLIAYLGVCGIGPWVREFIGLVPLLVLWNELLCRRRSVTLICISVLAAVHAVFPLLIPYEFHMLANTVPLASIFSSGSLGTQIETQTGSFDILGNRSVEVPMHLASLIPGTAYLVAAATAVAVLISTVFCRRVVPRGLQELGPYIGAAVAIAALIALEVADTLNRTAEGTFTPTTDPWSIYGQVTVPVVLAAALVTGAPPLIVTWAVASLIPFFRVYTEDVHLLYALFPFSLLVVWLLKRAVDSLKQRSRLRVMSLACLGIAFFASGQQLLNIVAVREFVETQTVTRHELAQRLDLVMTGHDTVITNALHPQDFLLYGHKRYSLLTTAAAGSVRPELALSGPPELEVFLRVSQPNPLFFLDVSQDYLPDQFNYHHHWLAQTYPDVIQPVFDFSSSAQYLSMDPITWIYDRKYLSFIGPPDNVNDFATNRSSRYPYLSVSADYHLYGVDVPRFRAEAGELRQTSILPLLVQRDYHGYNIVLYGSHFYAVQPSDGPFDYARFRSNQYTNALTAQNRRQARQLIDSGRAGDPQLTTLPDAVVVPREIDIYRGYSIQAYGGTYFAIAPGAKFDRTAAESRNFSGITGPTAESVYQQIDVVLGP